MRVEGLFRVPGNSVRQQLLRDALNNGTDIDLDSGEFHSNDVATLLKMFLGELPEPLLTHKHFHVHLKIAGEYKKEERDENLFFSLVKSFVMLCGRCSLSALVSAQPPLSTYSSWQLSLIWSVGFFLFIVLLFKHFKKFILYVLCT